MMDIQELAWDFESWLGKTDLVDHTSSFKTINIMVKCKIDVLKKVLESRRVKVRIVQELLLKHSCISQWLLRNS